MTYGADATEILPPTAVPIDFLLTNSIDGLPVAVVDDAGCIHHWSRGCAALYGWSAGEAIGAVKHVLLQSSVSGRSAPWPAVTDGAARRLEEIRRDGRSIHVLEHILPLDIPGYYALNMMQSNAADGRSADDSIRIALALGMNAIGLCSYDIPAKRLEWSQRRWRTLGVEDGTLSLDQMMAGGLGPASEQVMALCREALIDGRDEVEILLPIHGKRLGVRTVRFSARLVRNDCGVIDRFVGVMQDLTDADLRERALRDREAELRGILDTVSDAMVVVDGDGAIGAFSRAAQELLGYDSAAMIGKPIDPLVEGGWPAILAAVVHGGPREMSVIRAAGDRLPVELRTAPLPGKAASGQILFFTDISERRAKEARRTLFEQAARDIAIAEYAVHLRHELNQPLAAASNFLAVAQHLATDSARLAEVGEMIDMALRQIQRLGGIIRSTQRKAMGEDMDPRSVPIRTAIDEAVVLVTIAHGSGGVEIAIDVHPEGDTMFVDPIGIQQVLANLLRNAIEAFGPTPRPDARIEIASRRAGQRLLLSVSDNGPGIPPTAMAGLFEPFRQSAKKSGMGLGLSICRTIAEAHGGTLRAENTPAGGACFTLALPLHERDEVA